MKRISTSPRPGLAVGRIGPTASPKLGFHQKLGSSDQQPGDNLGISVAISVPFGRRRWWADLVTTPIGFISSPGAFIATNYNRTGPGGKCKN
ncbi:MAG: hypothetical protein IPJ00_11070 [Saprospirales bacterium]|nr:hypothetical protein [Saprospirales bacterium]